MRPRPRRRSGAGRFYEDFAVGDVFRSRFGRTVTQTDNIWFTCLTMNTNPIHFDEPRAARTQFGRPLVNSAFTLALITGLTVPDTSENAAANLAWTDIKLPEAGLRGRHAVGGERDPRGAGVGVEPERRASSRCAAAGINQRGEVVIEFKRTFMVYRRGAPEVADGFPATTRSGRYE